MAAPGNATALAAGPDIAAELDRLRRELAGLALPDARVGEIHAHLNQVPGKLLRPRLLFALARRYNLAMTDALRQAALVIELLHTASLLQDDVFDHEISRRGRPSTNLVFGDRLSLLAGDYLLVFAFRRADAIPDPAVRAILFEAALATCSGEITGYALDRPRELTLDNYLQTVRGKTGAAFRACGLIIRHGQATEDNEAETLAGVFGELYQFLDDIRDGMRLLRQNTPYALKDAVSLPLILALRDARASLDPLPGGEQLLELIAQRRGLALATDYLCAQYGWLGQVRGEDEFLAMLRALYQQTLAALHPECPPQP